MLSPGPSPAFGQDGRLGLFEGHGDIGSPQIGGSANYNAVSQEYSLSASGVNMWAARDEFHFAWKKLKGDFILQARVELLGQGVDPHRKLGFIARTSLDPDSPYADAAIHGDGLTSLQFRRTKGAVTEQVQSTQKAPDFVQLERKGNTYTMSVARFGDPLAASQIADLPLGDEVYVGLFLCSHNPAVVERAVFRDVRIIRPATDGFVPYRDYIGSVLEVLDVATGRRQVLYSSREPFEAPNWTRDGSALIYNTSGRDAAHRGRLHRFDLATRQASLIDTGFAIRNNNDHVLSFDGAMIGISDQSTNDGKSTIFTLPATGGTPKRISPGVGPSYLHGWSPDGKCSPSPAARNGEFDIYTIPFEGGNDKLTTPKASTTAPTTPPTANTSTSIPNGPGDHADLAHETRRQRPGTDHPRRIQQLVPPHLARRPVDRLPDLRKTWTPRPPRLQTRHPAPDAHRGGAAKVIAYVYGGQGTINVPSWSPDGRSSPSSATAT